MSTKVTTHERPGVYSVYDISSVISAGGSGKTAALIATGTGDGTRGSWWYTGTQAAQEQGDQAEITQLARLLLRNGAAGVFAVPVESEGQYTAALATVENQENIGVVVCESTDVEVQQDLRDSVEAASAARMERIAVVAGGAGESVEELTARAGQLNSERVVLVAPAAVDQEGTPLTGARAAAAVAGAIAGETDPALPLGGAVLQGLYGLEGSYADEELDALIQGGVTPLESVGGEVSVVRAVTTRTKTGGAADASWRELTTILVVDEVIPGIRRALRSRFQRAKNTAQSRGAIRSQVILELENRVDREIITGYEDVTVTALEEDPTVCLVEFSFTVAHGLNQIWLSAHITL